MRPHHKYPFKWVIAYKRPKSLELMNIKKKLKMDNLHFLSNNILTRLFVELKKIYKNDYQ